MCGWMCEWIDGWVFRSLESPCSELVLGSGNDHHSVMYPLSLQAPMAPGWTRVVGGDGQANEPNEGGKKEKNKNK